MNGQNELFQWRLLWAVNCAVDVRMQDWPALVYQRLSCHYWILLAHQCLLGWLFVAGSFLVSEWFLLLDVSQWPWNCGILGSERGQWLQHHRVLEHSEVSAHVGTTAVWYLRGGDAEDAWTTARFLGRTGMVLPALLIIVIVLPRVKTVPNIFLRKAGVIEKLKSPDSFCSDIVRICAQLIRLKPGKKQMLESKADNDTTIGIGYSSKKVWIRHDSTIFLT